MLMLSKVNACQKTKKAKIDEKCEGLTKQEKEECREREGRERERVKSDFPVGSSEPVI